GGRAKAERRGAEKGTGGEGALPPYRTVNPSTETAARFSMELTLFLLFFRPTPSRRKKAPRRTPAALRRASPPGSRSAPLRRRVRAGAPPSSSRGASRRRRFL